MPTELKWVGVQIKQKQRLGQGAHAWFYGFCCLKILIKIKLAFAWHAYYSSPHQPTSLPLSHLVDWWQGHHLVSSQLSHECVRRNVFHAKGQRDYYYYNYYYIYLELFHPPICGLLINISKPFFSVKLKIALEKSIRGGIIQSLFLADFPIIFY